jgi:DNA replication protein DnaC
MAIEPRDAPMLRVVTSDQPMPWYSPLPAEKEDEVKKILRKANFPEEVGAADLKKYPEEFADEAQPLFDGRLGIYIVGPLGVGKTHFATAIGRAWVRHRMQLEMFEALSDYNAYRSKDVSFVDMADMVRDIQAAKWRKTEAGVEGEEEAIKRYAERTLLVLDDLGADLPTSSATSILRAVIGRRYNKKRLSVITSNFSIDRIGERLREPRIAGRLRQMCRQIYYDGPDRRRATR